MNRPTSLIVLAAALVLLPLTSARAQNLDAQRPQLRAALEAAERGQFNAAQYAGLASHPIYGWVELATLRRDIDNLPTARAQAFLKRYEGQAVADNFRSLWLASLARRQDWPTFLTAWKPSDGATLRCAELDARQATGRADAQWTKDAQALWRGAAKSLPDGCDPVFAILANKGGLSPALRWERIDAAAAESQTAVMRTAARGLPADEAALANDYAAFIDAVHARALNWPKTDRSRRMASYGLARLASRNPGAAERNCRSTPARWAWPKPIVVACFTRSPCGRWRPTKRIRRGD